MESIVTSVFNAAQLCPATGTSRLQLPEAFHSNASCSWYAVYTMPRSEQSVRRTLDLRKIECFLPTFLSQRVWKNRQRVEMARALFPSYIFVCIEAHQRGEVLSSPGALRIIGNSRGPLPVPTAEIEFLRSDFCRNRLEPYMEFVVGTRVRIRCGAMQGVEGTLVEKRSSLRFVLTVAMINQHASVEVQADEIELLPN